MPTHPVLDRTDRFCRAFGLRIPVLMAPMAGACPPALAAAVAEAGGMGACGCLTMAPEQIRDWASAVRAGTNGAFQLNIWIPDPAPVRNPGHEAELRRFLSGWGPEVPEEAPDAPGPDFDAQCAAMLAAGPAVVSSIMGLFSEVFVAKLKAQGTRWFATATTVAEARPASCPVQAALTAGMRRDAAARNDYHALAAWAGQSARLAPAAPAADIATGIWDAARALLDPSL